MIQLADPRDSFLSENTHPRQRGAGELCRSAAAPGARRDAPDPGGGRFASALRGHPPAVLGGLNQRMGLKVGILGGGDSSAASALPWLSLPSAAGVLGVVLSGKSPTPAVGGPQCHDLHQSGPVGSQQASSPQGAGHGAVSSPSCLIPGSRCCRTCRDVLPRIPVGMTASRRGVMDEGAFWAPFLWGLGRKGSLTVPT